jgi:hypothetical protein
VSNKPTDTAVIEVTFPAAKSKLFKKSVPSGTVPIINATFTLKDDANGKVGQDPRTQDLIVKDAVNLKFKFSAGASFDPVRMTFAQGGWGTTDFNGEANLPSVDHVVQGKTIQVTNYFYDSSSVPGDVRWKMTIWLLDSAGKLVRIDPDIENQA